ncbi:hypothetical protein [Nocardioides zeicaulis]|uniref:Secreted protein n=1 Tax=Nocardioides zeicaulis TaxID=1776857 RepID=A0ABV6E2J2_9ACTN
MSIRQRSAVAVGSAVISLVAVHTPAGAAAEAPKQARKADSFWCYGTFDVIATRTFGPSDWKQQLGVRASDGARAVRVFHPSGRVDRYRFNNREANGTVWTTSATRGADACIVFSPGGQAAAQPEADNGYGWRTGYWQG